jgi:hypothetical protein
VWNYDVEESEYYTFEENDLVEALLSGESVLVDI